MRSRAGHVVALLTAVAALARADNLEEFPLSSRAAGMGGAYTALASDFAASYYNPAGLTLSHHLNLSLGWSFADYGLRFRSDNGGRDLDETAERIPDLSALTLGISTTIPLDEPDRIGFGLALFLPTRAIVDLKARAPTSEPRWFRYGEDHDRVHVIVSAGVKIIDALRVGLGANIFVDGEGGTVISAGLATPVQPEYELKLEPDAGVIASVLFLPHERVSIGLCYRSEVSFKLDFPALATVQGINLPILLEAITLFTPHQVQLGVVVDLDPVLLSFDLLYANWSSYRDPDLVVSSGVVAVPNRIRTDFNDVISPRIGVEVGVTRWMMLRGGYWWRNAIIDDQDGLQNLVDSQKHVFTMGVGFTFGEPSDPVTAEPERREGKAETFQQLTRDASFDIDLFFQLHWHVGRDQAKPPGDPVGDWDADGFIYNFGLSFTARF